VFCIIIFDHFTSEVVTSWQTSCITIALCIFICLLTYSFVIVVVNAGLPAAHQVRWHRCCRDQRAVGSTAWPLQLLRRTLAWAAKRSFSQHCVWYETMPAVLLTENG